MNSVGFLALALHACVVALTVLDLRASADDLNYVTVKTKNGELRGFSADTFGKIINTFYGIPYAKPPVGDLRYKPPEAHGSWSDVRDALLPGDRCVQMRSELDNATQSEDCLFVNIYTPNISAASKLPVMVWIHGGSYRTGEGVIYNGTFLATKDVVVVNFNYRLDALGFMSTEDDVMPGNYGMLDQVELLKWVRDNIEAFGGDPKNVTIFGESAGSAAISLLLLSPLAKDLFKGAIMESGVTLDPWGYAHPGRGVPHGLLTKLIAAEYGCISDNSSEILQCLQVVDAEDLINKTNFIVNLVAKGDILMSPRVETTYGFLPDLPIKLMVKGEFHHVNTIRGFNQHEFAGSMNLTLQEKIATAEIFMGLLNAWLKRATFVDKDVFAADIQRHYLRGISSGDHLAYAKAMEQLGTDFFFVGGIADELAFVSRASKEEKHFLYEFSVRPDDSEQPQWITAKHTDEIKYVFGGIPASSDPRQRVVSDTMMTLWTNFAKSGDPNTAYGSVADSATVWEPYTSDNHNQLTIRIDGNAQEKFDRPEVTDLYYEFLRRMDTDFVIMDELTDSIPGTACLSSSSSIVSVLFNVMLSFTLALQRYGS